MISSGFKRFQCMKWKRGHLVVLALRPMATMTTIERLVKELNFSEYRARDALDALGPDVELDAAVSWLLDQGEEDKGGAITLKRCPHVLTTTLVQAEDLVYGAPCCEPDCTCKETWICLVTGQTRCGRYGNRHSLAHWEKTGHHLALSQGDLSVWCYACSAYIDNAQVQPHVRRVQALKFGGDGGGGASGLSAVAEGEEAEEAEGEEAEGETAISRSAEVSPSQKLGGALVPAAQLDGAALRSMCHEAAICAHRWKQQLTLTFRRDVTAGRCSVTL